MTDTPTPAMTPEQRAELVSHAFYPGAAYAADQLEAALVGYERIVIRFDVSRRDLIELVKHDDDTDNYDLGPVDCTTPTRTLLLAILQHHLYDSPDGPQMEGEFTVMEGEHE